MWLTPELRDHLVYWKNPVESGIVFGSVLVLLVAVKYVSLIMVIGNLFLALVTSTMAFRIYKSVLSAVNKNPDPNSHPFQKYLDVDVELPKDKIVALTDDIVGRLNVLTKQLKGIFLLDNMFESLKFAAAMYLLTFVGRMINLITILITVWVVVFAWPKIYQDNKAKIDEALAPIKAKLQFSTLFQQPATRKQE